jgi:importin-7
VFSKAGRDYFKESCVCSRPSLQLPRVSVRRYLNQKYVLIPIQDREEALKDDFPLEDSAYDDEDEEDEWAGDDTAWNDETEPDDETDVKDEQSAYLEFLNEEVSKVVSGTNPETSNILQAQKFQNLDDNDSDDELGEESLLETPLDKIEPYQLFRDALLSKSAIL